MLQSLPQLPDWFTHVLMPVMRWCHIVTTSALLGGILFYEFVLPRALEDLKEEQQLAVFGRVRWIFRRIVLFSAVMLIISGVINTAQLWPIYTGHPIAGAGVAAQPRPWWSVHVGLGIIGIAIAIRITLGDRVPKHPIAWLRVTFVVLLVVVFAASVARHIRLVLLDQYSHYPQQPYSPYYFQPNLEP